MKCWKVVASRALGGASFQRLVGWHLAPGSRGGASGWSCAAPLMRRWQRRASTAATRWRPQAEAEARLRNDPYRERRWELLVLAIYRRGRQGAALEAYHHARAS